MGDVRYLGVHETKAGNYLGVHETKAGNYLGVHETKAGNYLGVHETKAGNYTSHIRLPGQGKNLYLGIFATPLEAARAYDAKALQLGGKCRKLNFPHEAAGREGAAAASGSHKSWYKGVAYDGRNDCNKGWARVRVREQQMAAASTIQLATTPQRWRQPRPTTGWPGSCWGQGHT
jgi:hypothetical protein